MSPETKITNLLYRYAELMDLGELEQAANLFREAKVKFAEGVYMHGAEAMLSAWQTNVKLYPCGTPRTKHVITNPIVEIDASGTRASCRSYYTVLQSTPDLPLQVIASGRYHDQFELQEGEWLFVERDYSLFDFQGDMSSHLIS